MRHHHNTWLITHGMYGTSFYKRWIGIRSRCNNPKHTGYARYGGRGIKCLWLTFESFRDDMYESYLAHEKIHGEKNTTIDRIDNEGDYKKSNCRWVTIKENSRNTSANTYVLFNGKKQCLTAWADELKINKNALYARINDRGWSIKRAFTTPYKPLKSSISS